MSQLHCYVPEELAKLFQEKADQAHMTVPKYLAMLVKREVDNQWPVGYFDLFGSWESETLERPEPAQYETRQAFE